MSTSKKKRRWPWILGIAATALGLTAFVYLKDEPLGDHSDLEPAAVAYSAENNGYEALLEACAASTVSADDDQLIYSLGRNGHPTVTWDIALARRLLSGNERVIEHLQAAVAAPKFICRQSCKPSDTREFYEGLGDMQRVVIGKCLLDLDRGDYQSAMRSAQMLFDLGRRLFESKGSLIETSLSLQMASRAIDLAEAVIDHAAASSGNERLHLIPREFASHESEVSAFKHAIALEFTTFANHLNKLMQSEEIRRHLSLFAMLQFKPNMTLNTIAEHWRGQIAYLDGKLSIDELPEPT